MKQWTKKYPSTLFLSGQVRTLTFSYTTLHLQGSVFNFSSNTFWERHTHTSMSFSLFGGWYICMSILHPHILSVFLSFCPTLNWATDLIMDENLADLDLHSNPVLSLTQSQSNCLSVLSSILWGHLSLCPSVHLSIHASLFIVHFAMIVFLRETVH